MGIWVTPKLSSLPDVAIAAAASGDILKYNGTDWANGDSGNLGQSLYVVASDASDAEKAKADYLCDGTNDEVQIQAAIDALPAVGGRIMLSAGNFTVARVGTVSADSLNTPYCILIDASDGPIDIMGVPGGTIVKLADSQIANSIPFLIRGSSGTKRSNPTRLYGITINGNSANQTAWGDFGVIEVAYADYVTVERCVIYDPPYFCSQVFRNSQYGKFLRNRYTPLNQDGMRFESAYHEIVGNTFIGDNTKQVALLSMAANNDISVTCLSCVVRNNIFNGGGLQMNMGDTSYSSVDGNLFINSLNASGWSVKLTDGPNFGSFGNVFAHNIFFNIRQGIILEGNSTTGVRRNVLYNNILYEFTGISLANGIVETGADASNNVIQGNFIYGATTAINAAGTGTRIRENIGYKTEASGTAQVDAAATTEDVTHGLATTPTRVQLTPTSDTDGKDYWVSAKGTTTFTITIDSASAGNITFDWRAVVGEE